MTSSHLTLYQAGHPLYVVREFKLSDDMFAQDSIELLKQSGIDFAKMEARGIDVSNFGELLMSSGIVLNEDVSISCFCLCQGYITCKVLCLRALYTFLCDSPGHIWHIGFCTSVQHLLCAEHQLGNAGDFCAGQVDYLSQWV